MGALAAGAVVLAGAVGSGCSRGGGDGPAGPSTEAAALPTGTIAFSKGGPGEVMLPAEVGVPAGLGVYTADVGIWEETRVTPESMLALDPAWSPAGDRIAFARYRVPKGAAPVTEIMVAAPDGSDPSRLTRCRPSVCSGDSGPDWSPDGTLIAFSRSTGSGSRVFVVDVAGGKPRRLAPLRRLSVSSGPRWSPDGSQIVFSAYPRRGRGIELYLMRADGSDVRKITTCEPPACEGGYTSATWSPGGDELAATHGLLGGPGGIDILSPDGTVVRSLTRCVPPDCNGMDSSPTWSPDGRFLAFARGDQFGSELYVIGADGEGLRRLVSFDGALCCLDWRPAPAGG